MPCLQGRLGARLRLQHRTFALPAPSWTAPHQRAAWMTATCHPATTPQPWRFLRRFALCLLPAWRPHDNPPLAKPRHPPCGRRRPQSQVTWRLRRRHHLRKRSRRLRLRLRWRLRSTRVGKVPLDPQRRRTPLLRWLCSCRRSPPSRRRQRYQHSLHAICPRHPRPWMPTPFLLPARRPARLRASSRRPPWSRCCAKLCRTASHWRPRGPGGCKACRTGSACLSSRCAACAAHSTSCARLGATAHSCLLPQSGSARVVLAVVAVPAPTEIAFAHVMDLTARGMCGISTRHDRAAG